jgi:hypothetical protein
MTKSNLRFDQLNMIRIRNLLRPPTIQLRYFAIYTLMFLFINCSDSSHSAREALAGSGQSAATLSSAAGSVGGGNEDRVAISNTPGEGVEAISTAPLGYAVLPATRARIP